MRERTLQLDDLRLHMIEAGTASGPSMLFVHGWPQCARAFERVMDTLGNHFRVAAIDLPGIGQSVGQPRSADKRTLAEYVHAAIGAAGLTDVTLVGHDIGGQIVYAYLHRFAATIERAVILNVVIPGVDPWSEVVRNPRIWHFGFHAVPELPERLVSGHQQEYFDFFFNAISADPEAITPEARRTYAQAYASTISLKAGFDWYRAFGQDEEDNAATAGSTVSTPVLCVRGQAERGKLEDYVAGLRTAGLVNVTGETIANAGHFSADEQPQALGALLRSFADRAY